MGADKPGQTPEGRLIEEAAKATGRSVRSLAANAGISDTHWRHLVRGWQPGPNGEPAPSRASTLTLARIAVVLGLTPEQLAEVGRGDVANMIPKVIAQGAVEATSLTPRPNTIVGFGHVSSRPAPDEIDLIVASNMPAREKLLRIRQVLELRAQVEAELREMAGDGTAEHEEAPAADAGASGENASETRQS